MAALPRVLADDMPNVFPIAASANSRPSWLRFRAEGGGELLASHVSEPYFEVCLPWNLTLLAATAKASARCKSVCGLLFPLRHD